MRAGSHGSGGKVLPYISPPRSAAVEVCWAGRAASDPMAFQCGDVRAFLCVADGASGGDRASEGRRGRIRLAHYSCLAADRRWAAAIPAAQPKVASTTAFRSLYVENPCARAFVSNAAATRLALQTGMYDDDDDRKKRHEGGHRKEGVSPEKMDEWMRDCVVVEQIVRNVGDAPFLLHVFSQRGGGGGGGGAAAALRLERETADAESWAAVRRRWERGMAARPDGVILVEELKGEGGGASVGSKTWGVVVQGRGADCAACYILNTCRVRSTFGFYTHFCLARAKCFGDTADVQLKKAWLAAAGGRQQPASTPDYYGAMATNQEEESSSSTMSEV